MARAPREGIPGRLFVCPARRRVYDARITARSPTPNEQRLTRGYVSTNGASARPPAAGLSRLLVLAYITAVSIPPLGLALGIAVALRLGKTKHAVVIVLLSLITAAAWVAILASGALDTASSNSI
ncbi:MAG: hypothetical protein JO244_06735 [Solirubrobacterales bacterium]|nr:hypothetical protein [Solirubrobacterales bacterium]